MLSLSMIVRDEEARLGECLRSVQGFADEMVVGGHRLHRCDVGHRRGCWSPG